MSRALPWLAGVLLVALPFVYNSPYPLHILVIILIWSFAYTSWSVMGRFGLTSLGHGGFMGVGAYVTALAWNKAGLSPWLGIPMALVAAAVLAAVVAYPCFRFRITGHYFALVTLALSGIVLQVITATRDHTGGSLGYTPERYQGGSSLYALQFTSKTTWYLIALGVWAAGLWVWYRVDRSMLRYALEAISEDEDAAAAAGVHVTAEKLKITVLSAVMTALAGALYCQYQLFISPDTVSGISVSLQMVFAAVVSGIYVAFGPTVGAVITIVLAEVLRISFGTRAVGWDNLVYGILLVIFIVFLPKGILGSLLALRRSPRKEAVILGCLALVFGSMWSLTALAQAPAKVPHIGYISPGASTEPARQRRLDAFRQGLRALGYVDGQNVIVEPRWAEGHYERYPVLAADLVQAKVDVIVTVGGAATQAAQRATATIPIVMTVVIDPLGGGLVSNLARPEGNVTGLSLIPLVGKQLEVLKEVAPKVTRVVVLANPGNPATASQLREAETAARTLGIRLRAVEARAPGEIEGAFSTMTGERALLILPDGVFTNEVRQIADLAVKNRLPSIYGLTEYAEAGGLMVYSPSTTELERRAATYVDKILKGARPADLPVEQPSKLDLVINLRTARTLGLTIPPALLLRADQVIR